LERISYDRCKKMLTINYHLLTVLEASYLLSNYDGYMDADKQQIVINGDETK